MLERLYKEITNSIISFEEAIEESIKKTWRSEFPGIPLEIVRLDYLTLSNPSIELTFSTGVAEYSIEVPLKMPDSKLLERITSAMMEKTKPTTCERLLRGCAERDVAYRKKIEPVLEQMRKINK